MEGIVGAGVTITPQVLERLRPSEISFNLAKHLLYANFRDNEGFPKQHLFPQIQRLARRWLDEGYLVTSGVPIGAILYQDQLARAAEKIDIALTRGSEGRLLAVLEPSRRFADRREGHSSCIQVLLEKLENLFGPALFSANYSWPVNQGSLLRIFDGDDTQRGA
jgi:hypothetical protein